MTKKRKRYTAEFKAEAVRLVRGGLSQAQVARDLGISPGTLTQWVRLLRDEEDGVGKLAEVEEVRRLRRLVAQLKEERDILKKATAYFARESK